MDFTFISLIFLSCIALSLCDTSDCPYDACIEVINKCGVPLFLQRTMIDGIEINASSVTRIKDGETLILDISDWWSKVDGEYTESNQYGGQRLYAWWQDPTAARLNPLIYSDKVEINWCFKDTMCYNPTAVDYFALPVFVGPHNPNDCRRERKPTTGFGTIPVRNIEAQCPTKFISTSPFGVCLSSGLLCRHINWTEAHWTMPITDPHNPLCTSLEDIIATCIADGNCDKNLTTPDVWLCNESMQENPRMCAALHRGLYDTVANGGDQSDPSLFYKTEPYNPYGKFLHQDPEAKIYAFPYDDWEAKETSGYKQCTTTYMRVEWCPVGADSRYTTPKPTPSPTQETSVINEASSLIYWELMVADKSESVVTNDQLFDGYQSEYFYTNEQDNYVLVVPEDNGNKTALIQTCHWPVTRGTNEISADYKIIAQDTTYAVLIVQSVWAADAAGYKLCNVKWQSGSLYAMVATTDDLSNAADIVEHGLGVAPADEWFTLKTIVVDGHVQFYVNDELRAKHDVGYWRWKNNYFKISNTLQDNSGNFRSMIQVRNISLSSSGCFETFNQMNGNEFEPTRMEEESPMDMMGNKVGVVVAVLAVLGLISGCSWYAHQKGNKMNIGNQRYAVMEDRSGFP